MWGWPNANQSDQGAGPSGSAVGNHSAVPVVTSAGNSTHPQSGNPSGSGQELTEMLTMLDQSGTTSFEDLNINMFSTPFE